MNWRLSHRADPEALPLADRHYNRQKPGTPQFVPPGKCLVMLSGDPASALWISSWPIAEYVKHAWAGAWMCTCFRNESKQRASSLIEEAVAATVATWGEPPSQGFVSFIHPGKVKPTIVHGVPRWGWTWEKSGWEMVGITKGGLFVFQLPPSRMPKPHKPKPYFLS